jgi:hypothetical protein
MSVRGKFISVNPRSFLLAPHPGPLVSEFPSNLVWKYGHGKMGLPSGLQAGRQWRGRVRIPLAPAFDQVRKEPEPFVPVS